MTKLYQELDPETGDAFPALFTLDQWRATNDVQADTYLAEVLDAIQRLEPGETYTGGGGAAAEFQIRCVRYAP